MKNLMQLDLYELLNIGITAEDKEIKSAYRRKALTCHPDKNPDNPKSADLFQELSKALEILTDKSARAAYDKVWKGRQTAIARHQELDGERKRLKEDLEAREKAAQENDELGSAQKLKKEIERLRREGSRLVEDEKELLRRHIMKEKIASSKNDLRNETLPSRLKLQWNSRKSDETNGGYNQQVLDDIFKKYGTVTCYVSAKKRGRAILEFMSPEAAQMAFESEKGTPSNPLTISLICGPAFQTKSSTGGPPPDLEKDNPVTSRDFESLVLRQMRQAEERRKLTQKMMEEGT